jgi:hypothetical protein
MKTPLNRLEDYQAANLRCARIIAADPRRYRGLMRDWAARVLSCEPNKTFPAANVSGLPAAIMPPVDQGGGNAVIVAPSASNAQKQQNLFGEL